MEATLENALTVAVVGLVTVFVTLYFFCLVIQGINKLDKIVAARKKQKQQAAVSVQSTASSADDENIVPIIAAAVNAAVGENVVIRKITFAGDTRMDTSWSHISRAKHIDSHNINIQTRMTYGK